MNYVDFYNKEHKMKIKILIKYKIVTLRSTFDPMNESGDPKRSKRLVHNGLVVPDFRL